MFKIGEFRHFRNDTNGFNRTVIALAPTIGDDADFSFDGYVIQSSDADEVGKIKTCLNVPVHHPFHFAPAENGGALVISHGCRFIERTGPLSGRVWHRRYDGSDLLIGCFGGAPDARNPSAINEKRVIWRPEWARALAAIDFSELRNATIFKPEAVQVAKKELKLSRVEEDADFVLLVAHLVTKTETQVARAVKAADILRARGGV